jgi:DNA-directed RNA polymerase specialized sigma24 family protein
MNGKDQFKQYVAGSDVPAEEMSNVIQYLRFERRLSYRQIGEIFGITKQAIHQRLQGDNYRHFYRATQQLRDDAWLKRNADRSARDIAEELGVHVKTVQRYRRIWRDNRND